MADEDLGTLLDEELEHALSPKNFITEGDCMFAKGTKIGEFEIISRLGNSGLGELYLARSVVSRKRFALKVFPPCASEDADFEEFFSNLRAQALARIHPHIVHIQKMGCYNDDVLDYHYIAMDYIESSLGRPLTLQDMVNDQGRLSENKTLKIVLQLCDALDYAHHCKEGPFIHSDLKPANILFDTANLVRLSDFDAISLLGRRYVKETVKHCVNKAQSEEWAELVVRQETIRLPAEKNMDSTEAHLLLDSPGKFSLKDLGISRLIKSDYIRDFLDSMRLQAKGAPIGKAGEKSFRRQAPKGSPTGITAIYSVLESYDYMSPEQKAGQPTTAQSNIYSIGLIIYRMLTGRKMAGCWDLPSKFGVSKSWDKIVIKCLKMEPEERYASVEELTADLMAVHTKPVGIKSLLLIAFVVALCSTLAAVFWGNGLTSKFSNIFSMHGGIERINTSRANFALKIKVLPPGAKVKVFKGQELIESNESIPADGFEINAENALFTIVASAPGRAQVKHEFRADSALREFCLTIPASDEVRTYMKRTALSQPSIGFLWEIEDMKLTFIPISPDAQDASASRPASLHPPQAPFWIASTELRQWNYEKVMRNNPSAFRDQPSKLPVEHMSLAQAMEFCKRLSEIEHQAGRLPDGYIYRLPTEAEWEYCARTSSAAKPADDSKNLAKYAWYQENSQEKTHPTAALKANPWGIFDMQGNVWEYCADIIKRPNPDDPSQMIFVYMAKGGAWNSTIEDLQFSSRRIVTAIDKREKEIGIRVVLAPPIESPIIDEMPDEDSAAKPQQ